MMSLVLFIFNSIFICKKRIRDKLCSTFKMSIKIHTANIFFSKINSSSKQYVFDTFYPGTAPPGLIGENVPLTDILTSNINNLNVQEFSRDKKCGSIRSADESILDWLRNYRKIKLKFQENNMNNLSRKNQTLLDDEFEFDDNKESLENFYNISNSRLIDFI
nr:hypothetical protein 1634Bnrm2_p138 [Cryptomonas sp.]